MKKDSFYFPHFCNARHDRKIKRVIKELGVEGYGIYFMLLEVLREQTDFRFPLSDIDLLADEFGTSEQKVRVVICNYDLFQVDEKNNFFSARLVYYLQPYIEKSERAREANRIRWSKVKDDMDNSPKGIQMDSDTESKCNTSKNPSKVKQSKLNKVNKSVPVLSDRESAFERFWSLLPRKEDKQAAKKVFVKLTDDELSEIRQFIKTHLLYWGSLKEKGEAKYIPHPKTWLNGKRWRDEVPQVSEIQTPKFVQ